MRPTLEYARQFGRFQRNARLYLINNALSGVTVGILLVLYNLYLVSLGYGANFVGFVLFTLTIGAGVAIFPAGICVDRFNGKAILIWSNLIMGLAGIGQILFRQPVPLLVSGFLEGAAFAFTLVINAPFLTRNSSPEERPLLFSMNISLGLITLVLGEVLGGALPLWLRSIRWLMAPLPGWAAPILASQPDPRSYQLALLFAGAIAGPSLIPLFMLRNNQSAGRSVGTSVQDRPQIIFPDDERPRGPGDRERATAAPTAEPGVASESERATAAPTMKPGAASESERATARVSPPLYPTPALTMITVKRLRSAWYSFRSNLTFARLNALLRSPFFFLMLVYVFTGLGAGLFYPYYNLFFVQHLKATSALFGLIDGGANALTALTTLVAPWLAARIGRINTIALTRLLSIPLLLIVGLTSILPLAALLYPFRQGIMDMSNGVLQVYSMEAVPEKFRGLANSSYQAAYQVPWAISASLGGLIIVQYGYPPIFLLGALCYILSIVVLWARFGLLHFVPPH